MFEENKKTANDLRVDNKKGLPSVLQTDERPSL